MNVKITTNTFPRGAVVSSVVSSVSVVTSPTSPSSIIVGIRVCFRFSLGITFHDVNSASRVGIVAGGVAISKGVAISVGSGVVVRSVGVGGGIAVVTTIKQPRIGLGFGFTFCLTFLYFHWLFGGFTFTPVVSGMGITIRVGIRVVASVSIGVRVSVATVVAVGVGMMAVVTTIKVIRVSLGISFCLGFGFGITFAPVSVAGITVVSAVVPMAVPVVPRIAVVAIVGIGSGTAISLRLGNGKTDKQKENQQLHVECSDDELGSNCSPM